MSAEVKTEAKSGYSRRQFLKVLGASAGAATVGCTQAPVEKIIPYVVRPDEVIPGVATWYAGTCGECSAGCSTLVRTREGRVVKVEGNKKSPINRGGLCALGQSSLQTLYDPDRVREPLAREAAGAFKPVSWDDALGRLASAIKDRGDGKQMVIVTEGLGPSERALLERFQSNVKNVRHIEFELLGSDVVAVAAERVFGSGVTTRFDFSEADVVVSVGAGFLETWLNPVESSRQWAERRKPEAGPVSYFAHIEPRLSLTAANADHWISNAPGTEELLLGAMLAEIVAAGRGGSAHRQVAEKFSLKDSCLKAGVSEAQIKALVKRLIDASTSLVIAGPPAAGSVEAAVLANLINSALGNLGKSVVLEQTSGRSKTSHQEMVELLEELNGDDNSVDVMLVHGPNLSYLLPEQLGKEKAFGKLKTLAAMSCNLDETASDAHIVLPKSTAFEAWNDGNPRPGVTTLNQPAMQPLYKTLSFGDTLIALAKQLDITFGEITSFYDFIREQWKSKTGGSESKWQEFVREGGEFKRAPRSLRRAVASSVDFELNSVANEGLALLAFPLIQLADGRAANRSWAQEIPEPLTTAVWGSWIELHPTTAKKLNLGHGQVARIRTGAGAVEAPVFVRKEIHPDAVAMPIGQGHKRMGRYANGVGANVLSVLPGVLKGGVLQLLVSSVSVDRSPWTEELVVTQDTRTDLGRGFGRKLPESKFEKLAAKAHGQDHGHGDGAHGDAHHDDGHHRESKYKGKGGHHGDRLDYGPTREATQMYKQMEHPVYNWGMAIDLASCTGCSACVTACYAENNVPTVGKDLMSEGREMSWIRIDRYFDGPEDSPATFVPMMCQHCNNAPCEPVCPVYATYHNEQGLNHMVYNRCVGTRYCANNCSYKVRRFNWFKYTWPEPLDWQLNPDVTVREVGIMEKCSFCIQRIREAENTAKNEGRLVKDGDVSPACASSCPTDAISFGNLKEKESRVAKEHASARSYKILDFDLNTQPSVAYLASVMNDSKV